LITYLVEKVKVKVLLLTFHRAVDVNKWRCQLVSGQWWLTNDQYNQPIAHWPT